MLVAKRILILSEARWMKEACTPREWAGIYLRCPRVFCRTGVLVRHRLGSVELEPSSIELSWSSIYPKALTSVLDSYWEVQPEVQWEHSYMWMATSLASMFHTSEIRLCSQVSRKIFEIFDNLGWCCQQFTLVSSTTTAQIRLHSQCGHNQLQVDQWLLIGLSWVLWLHLLILDLLAQTWVTWGLVILIAVPIIESFTRHVMFRGIFLLLNSRINI